MTTSTIIQDRLKFLESFELLSGAHRPPSKGKPPTEMCFNEAVAWLAGEPHSDTPACVCRAIRNVTLRFNDRCGDSPAGIARRRRVLVPLYTVVVGTRGSAALERRRVWMAADWAYRIATPSLLRRTKSLEPWAVKLEELEEIRDEATLKAARELIYKCREASWDARREALASLRRRFSAVADADAVADAVADVAAVADAVAAADVAAAAVADADAVAVAVAWRRIFDAAKSVKGDYWAKRQAADPVARKVIDQIRPGRLAWRDKLDDDFGQLVRRMAALTEADAA